MLHASFFESTSGSREGLAQSNACPAFSSPEAQNPRVCSDVETPALWVYLDAELSASGHPFACTCLQITLDSLKKLVSVIT